MKQKGGGCEIYSIEEIKRKTIPVAMRYGVRNLRLFGSYASGEANAQSDVDLRIDRGNLTGLFSYFAMVDELEQALGCHVDLVLDDSQDQQLLNRIQQEEAQLYAAQ